MFTKFTQFLLVDSNFSIYFCALSTAIQDFFLDVFFSCSTLKYIYKTLSQYNTCQLHVVSFFLISLAADYLSLGASIKNTKQSVVYFVETWLFEVK